MIHVIQPSCAFTNLMMMLDVLIDSLMERGHRLTDLKKKEKTKITDQFWSKNTGCRKALDEVKRGNQTRIAQKMMRALL